MAGFMFKVIGAEAVKKALDKGAGKGISEALKKLALKAEALAKKATVVDTGRLRSSITSRTETSTAFIGTAVEYGEFVEYGTAKMEARHMEEGTKVLGEGMMTYTVKSMDDEIKEFGENVTKEVKRNF